MGVCLLLHVGLVILVIGVRAGLVDTVFPELVVSAAHLFGVFFDAFFTHFHGWRHGVFFYKATEFSTAIQKIFSVSASMRQHATFSSA